MCQTFSRLIFTSSLLFISLLFWTIPLICQQIEASVELEQLNQQIEANQTRLATLKLEQLRLDQELKLREQSIKKISDEEQQLNQKLVTLEAARKAAETELRAVEKKENLIRQKALNRMRVMYMVQPEPIMFRLLGSERSRYAKHFPYFFSKVRQYDRDLLEQVNGIVRQKDIALLDLESLVSQQNKSYQEVSDRRKALATEIEHRARLKKTVLSQQASLTEVLTGLKAQALRLETVLNSVLQSASESGISSAAVTGVQDSGTTLTKVPKEESLKKLGPYQGSGLASKRSRLLRPADCMLVRRFGRYRPSEFEELVYSKGLELSCAEGSEVKSIAAGRVVFVGRLPSLGQVLIVDHGKRSYSLLGRLERVVRNIGEEVEIGDRLGFTGETDAKERNLYLEIRVNGTSVDPQRYLRQQYLELN